jgi:hypothetical protein
VPSALAVELAERVARAAGPEVARVFYKDLPRARVARGDELLTSRLVDLVARGVAPREELSPEGQVELEARLHGPRASADAVPAGAGAPGGPAGAAASSGCPLDAAHAALLDPRAPRPPRARVPSAGSGHPVSVVADVHAFLAAKTATPSSAPANAALARRVRDAGTGALELAARLELARALGDAEEASRARTLLAARAVTSYEKSLVARP